MKTSRIQALLFTLSLSGVVFVLGATGATSDSTTAAAAKPAASAPTVSTAVPMTASTASTVSPAKTPTYPIQVTASCDKPAYVVTPTSTLKATLVIKNNTSSTHILTFNTAQKYDFVIRDSQGKEVLRWSSDKLFAQVITDVSIKAGEELKFAADLPLGEPSKPLPEGSYTLEGTATYTTDSGQPDPAALPANVDNRTSPRVAFKIIPMPTLTLAM
jgi:hypothetical protein